MKASVSHMAAVSHPGSRNQQGTPGAWYRLMCCFGQEIWESTLWWSCFVFDCLSFKIETSVIHRKVPEAVCISLFSVQKCLIFKQPIFIILSHHHQDNILFWEHWGNVFWTWTLVVGYKAEGKGRDHVVCLASLLFGNWRRRSHLQWKWE